MRRHKKSLTEFFLQGLAIGIGTYLASKIPDEVIKDLKKSKTEIPQAFKKAFKE